MGGMCNGHLRTPNAQYFYLTYLYVGHRHAKNCRRQSKNRATSPRCVLFEVTTPYHDEYRPKCQFCPQRCCCCCYASAQLALQLHQERAQGVCSNKEAQKHLAKSNGTPTMDLGHMNVVLKWCVCILLVDLGIGIIIIIVVFFVCPPLRVEFLLNTDSGYPKDTGVHKTWQPLGIPSAIIPIGQLHQSPPSPIPGDLGRGPSHQSTCSNIETRMDRPISVVRVIRGVA